MFLRLCAEMYVLYGVASFPSSSAYWRCCL